MYNKFNPPTEESNLQEQFRTLHLNINNNDSNHFSGDISYSSIDSNDNYDAMSYATEDFKSCTSGSGVFSLKSRVYRKTFLSDLNASILKKLNGDDGFEKGYDEFTEKKSVLFLCLFVFLAYMLLGTFAFSYYFENWTPIDAMYFTVVTFTTCGYGDLVPVGDHERLFTLIFIILGITVLGGICLTILFDSVFGYYEDMIDAAKERSAEKFMQKSMDKVDKKSRNLYFHQEIEEVTSSDTFDEVPSYFDEIRSLWPFLLLISVGAAYIGYADQWDVITTLYYFVVTATSVGYGDIAPESQKTRLFAVIYIPCSVMITAHFFGRLINVYLQRKAIEAEEEFLSRRMTVADFKCMDTDQDGSVTYDEFIRFFLVQLGKVQPGEMDRLKELYDKFDVNNDGSIQMNDLILMAKGPDNFRL